MGIFVGILLFLFFADLIVCSLVNGGNVTESGVEHSLGYHHAYGTHRVRYPDGQISQPFTHRVAEDYREIFGGEIIPR